MFCLSIHVGQVVWTMLYKSEARAKEFDALLSANAYSPAHLQTPNWLVIADDFGQTASITPRSLHGWMLEDLDLSKLAHVEKGLHNARTQNDYVKRVQADPSARSQMQGPPMLAPGGNGLFRPQ